ncbi:hypothetical protein LHJ74_13545 [Streptomyces sp. N2-109]|uniref:DUF4185 domain-containing protein n=1 Tax=Streptomyces gossypii TaxID=2883101 RepID=A0ABT2JT30_9ACTN|nr:hypothetical protein [Streptomyces gossypii]MCT2590921.1 hypothetical protein [Streptomyces gossypii]
MADPDPATIKDQKPGDTVHRLEFPTMSLVTEGNEFAARLKRSDIKDKDYISDDNRVQFVLAIRIPREGKPDKHAETGATVEYTGGTSGIIPWADPLTTPEDVDKILPKHELRPVFREVEPKEPLPSQTRPTTAKPTTLQGYTPPCQTKTLLKHEDVWAYIGETYPVGEGTGGMSFTNEAEVTYEAAASLGGWSAEKTVTVKNETSATWEPRGWARKYLVGIRYKQYQCVYQGKDQVDVWSLWEPVAHTSETDDKKIERPDWIGSNTENCGPVTTEEWNRSNESGGSEGIAWEGKLPLDAKKTLEIGIDLGVKREWSTASTVTYNMTRGVNQLCGVDEKPGFASKIGQHSVVKHKVCSNFEWPVAKQVEAKAPPESKFLNYAENTPNGWTGGDSTYSVRLPDGRLLWMFSDTFLGPLNADGTRPTNAPLVNSSFVAQNDSSLKTITGGTTDNPRAIMPNEDPHRWYWLGDGMVGDVQLLGEERPTKRLQVIYHQWHRYDPTDAWGFKLEKMVIATFDLGNLKNPIDVREIPSDIDPSLGTPSIQWGSAILPASQSGDGYTYIYGIDDAPTHKKMRVARVKGTDLTKTYKWVFLNKEKNAWMGEEAQGSNIITGVANEFSVTKWHGSFVLVSQDTTEAFSRKVRLWAACDPYTGFGHIPGKEIIYETPETGLWGSYGDGLIYAYNAHVHDTLGSGDRWTLSYNVNSLDTTVGKDGAHYRDPSIYKPRFVSFTLVPTGSSLTTSDPEDPAPDSDPPPVADRDYPCAQVCMGVPSRSGS